MSSERWNRIETIYHSALEQNESERIAFIKEACAGDEVLLREVEILLAYDKHPAPFIDKFGLQIVAQGLAVDLAHSMLGRQIGSYKIISLLGAGGMGEVYRAIDTRLNRTVAIKLLPSHLSARPELRKRFEREARVISNLNHPHICTLYDIGQQEGFDYLVMEYLEGETLAQRLKKGSLPLDEVLQYALEIGDALALAHQQGVIHRDLKPGNIMLTTRGTKLLDFGLAKLEAEPKESGLSSTIALAAEGKSLTAEGIIIGTLEYMAPEQLEGKEIDARSDVFSLGTVIYEMATGRKAFTGGSKASVIVAILTGEPVPVTSIQPLTPPGLEEVVQKCLRKEPGERWQSVAEVTGRLKQIARNVPIFPVATPVSKTAKEDSERTVKGKTATLPISAPVVRQPKTGLSWLLRSRVWKLRILGLLFAVSIGSLVFWQVRWQQGKPAEKTKEITFRPLTSYSVDNPLESAAISPDGKYLVFCSKGKLFIQIIRPGEKRTVPLPEGFRVEEVHWFPDGTKLLLNRTEDRWVQSKGGVIRHSDASLWSLSILGGVPQKIVDDAIFPSVSPDGSIVAFSRFELERPTVAIWAVGASGGGARRLWTPSQPNESNFAPIWSSNGERIFYIRDDGKAHWIESCDLKGEQVTNIFPSKSGVNYDFGWEGIHGLCWAPSGRILFAMEETRQDVTNLWEIRVDAATGRPLTEARRFTQWTGFQTVHAHSLSITADGKKLVVLRGNTQADVYVAELEPGGKAMKNPRRLTLVERDDAVSGWTADSRAVLFQSNRGGNSDIFTQDISLAEAETIIASPGDESHPNLSPDGAFILYLVAEENSPTANRLMRIPVVAALQSWF